MSRPKPAKGAKRGGDVGVLAQGPDGDVAGMMAAHRPARAQAVRSGRPSVLSESGESGASHTTAPRAPGTNMAPPGPAGVVAVLYQPAAVDGPGPRWDDAKEAEARALIAAAHGLGPDATGDELRAKVTALASVLDDTLSRAAAMTADYTALFHAVSALKSSAAELAIDDEAEACADIANVNGHKKTAKAIMERMQRRRSARRKAREVRLGAELRGYPGCSKGNPK